VNDFQSGINDAEFAHTEPGTVEIVSIPNMRTAVGKAGFRKDGMYDAVFVEELNVKEMLEQSHNARNKQDAAWRQFITLLEYKADLYGCHVVRVEARGTTKECASCGVETAKRIRVREHSYPSCRFETDRDANAAMNVLKRGFAELGLGWPEDTPVETVTATDTTHFESVSASQVVETGSLGVVRKSKISVMTRDEVSRTT
jgi:putative transposase